MAFGNVVEAVDGGIWREDVLDFQPRSAEQIAEGVFVFLGVEAAADRAAFLLIELFPGGEEGISHFLEECLDIAGLWLVLVLRGHLSGSDPVIDVRPDSQVVRAFRIEIKIHDVEACLGLRVVVAVPAVFLEEKL